MPIFAVSILLQILCIVHIIRTGRDRIWVYVVFLLPMPGMAAYLAVEVVPSLVTGRTARTVSHQVCKQVDPGRDIRARRRAVELADTIENRRLLAEALLDAKQFDEAAQIYKGVLTGIHRDDPALLFGLARARAGQGDLAGGLVALDELAQAQGGAEPIERRLLRAICLEWLERPNEALVQYAAIADRYPGEEARCRYAGLLERVGRRAEAQLIYEEILRRARLGNRYYRGAQREWIDRAKQALAA